MWIERFNPFQKLTAYICRSLNTQEQVKRGVELVNSKRFNQYVSDVEKTDPDLAEDLKAVAENTKRLGTEVKRAKHFKDNQFFQSFFGICLKAGLD